MKSFSEISVVKKWRTDMIKMMNLMKTKLFTGEQL